MTTLVSTSASAAVPTPTRRRKPLTQRRGAVLVGRGVVIIGAACLWQLSSTQSSMVPAPSTAASTLAGGFTDGWIYPDLTSTGIAVAVGFLAALVIGLPLGMWLGRTKAPAAVIDPLLYGAFAVPRTILYPILLTIFGVGLEAKEAKVFISALFPIVLMTAAAVKAIDPTILKLGRAMNLSLRQTAIKLIVPAAAPGVMAAIRIGFSVALISVVIAEFFASDAGIGQAISAAYGLQQLETMYALILLVFTTALGINMALWVIETRVRGAVE